MKTVVTLLCLIPFSAAILGATLIGPVYPAPGGNSTAGSSGTSGTAAGRTNDYSGFDPTQYGQLYWGPTDILNIYNTGDPAPADMQYIGSVAANVYEFDSTTPWTFYDSFEGPQQLRTRMLLTVSGLGVVDTAGDLLATGGNSTYPLFNVTGNFTANLVFQSFDDGTWTAITDYQNANNNGNGSNVQRSATFAFYSTSAAPEPSTMLMFGTGLAGLGFVRRRRSAR
jgi:hypothetical protein